MYGSPLLNSTSSRAPWFPFRALSFGSEGFQEWSSQPSKSIKRVETCKTVHLAWRLTLTTDTHILYTSAIAPAKKTASSEFSTSLGPERLSARLGLDKVHYPSLMYFFFQFYSLAPFSSSGSTPSTDKDQPVTHRLWTGNKRSASLEPRFSFEANQEYPVQDERTSSEGNTSQKLMAANAMLLSIPLWGR